MKIPHDHKIISKKSIKNNWHKGKKRQRLAPRGLDIVLFFFPWLIKSRPWLVNCVRGMKLTTGSLRFHIPRLAKHGGSTHKDYLDARQVCTLKNHKHLEVLTPSPQTNQTWRRVSGFLTGTWGLERDKAPVDGINHSQSGPLLQKNFFLKIKASANNYTAERGSDLSLSKVCAENKARLCILNAV